MNIGGGGEAILVLVACLLAPAGVWLLFVHRRRRSGVRSYCAACDYPLAGLPADAARCPECGADLRAAGAIETGRRRADPALVLAAIGLLLPALAVAALVATRALRKPPAVATVVRTPAVTPPPPPPAPAPVPVNVYADVADDALADAILAEPAPPDIGALLGEATDRAKASAKAAPTSAPSSGNYGPDPWVARLVDATLARQADATREFPPPWARFVESLRSTRHLPHERWRQYLQAGVKVDASFRDSIVVGAAFPYEYRTTVRVSPELAQRLQCRTLSLSLGDVTSDEPLRYDPKSADQFRSTSTYWFRLTPEQWKRIPPGDHVVRLTALVAHQGINNATGDWLVRIERPIKVLPRTERYDRHEYTPGLDEAMARSLYVSAAPGSAVADGLRWTGGGLALSIACDGAPADLYAQVSVSPPRSTGAHIVGWAHWRKGERAVRELKLNAKEFGAMVGKPIEVTLIGGNAEGTLLSGEWWRGTVKFDGVTLIDATSDAPATRPESLSVPELQIHRPGTKLRPFGYYPVEPATRATTRPTASAAGARPRSQDLGE